MSVRNLKRGAGRRGHGLKRRVGVIKSHHSEIGGEGQGHKIMVEIGGVEKAGGQGLKQSDRVLAAVVGIVPLKSQEEIAAITDVMTEDLLVENIALKV